MVDGVHTTEPAPDGFEGERLTIAPDGALWVIGGTGRLVEREGITDTEWALIRYDGADLSTIVLPFPEPNDLAIHPDGTVWISSSSYGVFTHEGGEWVRYSADGLPDEAVSFVEIGPDGAVYVGSRLGVTRISAEPD
jgi:sugar lactone lactonase YvrE